MITLVPSFLLIVSFGALPCTFEKSTAAPMYPPGLSASGTRFLFKQTGVVKAEGWTSDGRFFVYKAEQERNFHSTKKASEENQGFPAVWEEAVVLELRSGQKQKFLLSAKAPKRGPCAGSIRAFLKQKRTSLSSKEAFLRWKQANRLQMWRKPAHSGSGFHAKASASANASVKRQGISWSFQGKEDSARAAVFVWFRLLRGKEIVASHLESYNHFGGTFLARRSLEVSWSPQGTSVLWLWRSHTASTMRGPIGEEATFFFVATPLSLPLPVAQVVFMPGDDDTAKFSRILKLGHLLQMIGFAASIPTKAQKDRKKSVVYVRPRFTSHAAQILRFLPPGASVEPLTWKTTAACVVALDRSFRD